MEVILTESVSKLGGIGDVVKVKDGFARNYLIPRKLAQMATSANLKTIELRRKKQQASFDEEKKAAQKLAEDLAKVSATVNVEVNDLDKLYGAITEVDVAKALEVEGFNIDKKQIVLESPIEELGIFDVSVKLHSEVIAKIRLWVTKK